MNTYKAEASLMKESPHYIEGNGIMWQVELWHKFDSDGEYYTIREIAILTDGHVTRTVEHVQEVSSKRTAYTIYHAVTDTHALIADTVNWKNQADRLHAI